MRRLTVAVVLVCVVLTALPAAAGKIGFVNAERAAVEVEEGKRKWSEFQRWQAPQQARLDTLRDQVMALREQLAKAQGTATPEQINEIQQREIDSVRAFEDARRVYERELDARQAEFLSTIANRISELGKEYAEANDYDAVFLMTAQPMVYVAPGVDITDVLIALYNERYPVE